MQVAQSHAHHTLSVGIDRRICSYLAGLTMRYSFHLPLLEDKVMGSLPEEHPANRCEHVVSIPLDHVTAL